MALLRRLMVALMTLPAAAMALAEESPTPTQLRFEQEVSRMLAVRTEAYRFAESSGITRDGQPKLTRGQSNQLRDLAQRYIDARAPLLNDAEKVAHLFNGGTAPTITQHRGTSSLPAASIAGLSIAADQHWINPLDEAGQKQLTDILRGTAAAMVLWDSYRIAVMPYAENADMQYALTFDVGKGLRLRDLTRNYYSTEMRAQLAGATRFVDGYMEWRRRRQMPVNAEEEYLYTLVQSAHWYKDIRELGGIGIGESLRFANEDIRVHRAYLRNLLSHGLSMGFGNMVGLVQTRSGYLKKMPAGDMDALAAELKPLDILLEKTPFRLTDKMIPGYYGHVAIWLGSEAELRALGVWDSISPELQAHIRDGRRIVEALRVGVTMSSLPHFLNIDDLLVLRDTRPLTDDYRRQAVLTALAQVGKEYDFNFDVYSHSRIVCSELAYVVFPDISWPLARTMGRYTISPDNVAQLAVGTAPVLAPAILYRNGKRVNAALPATLAALIASPGTGTATAAGR